jgi:CheY-like chemotaxis protein
VLPSSQAAGEAAVVAPSPAGQNALVARRILVAEDMPGNRRVVGLMLQRLGQTPRFAENGEAAVLSWREHRQEIILMDVNMPGVDGREATRRIRAESGDMQRPWIIAVTAGAMSEERDAALAAGMNDFITKPITGEMLAGALRRAPAADTAG